MKGIPNMTPDVTQLYNYYDPTFESAPGRYTYRVVFQRDYNLGVTYPEGPFTFVFSTDQRYDHDRIDWVLVGLKWDPIGFIVHYDGVRIKQISGRVLDSELEDELEPQLELA
jgi:hypothetical protein